MYIFRLNDNVKNENGFIPGMNNVGGGGISSNVQSNRPQNMDIKLIHAKKQQAEMRRNQKARPCGKNQSKK